MQTVHPTSLASSWFGFGFGVCVSVDVCGCLFCVLVCVCYRCMSLHKSVFSKVMAYSFMNS